MFKLVEPNCFAAIAAAIAEAALRLPQQYRMAYVLARVEQEMRSANSLRDKVWKAKREAYRDIRDLFEALGIENPDLAILEVDIMGRRRGFSLKRFLERQAYATAHQAIRAITQIDTVQDANQRYHVAKQDKDDVWQLVTQVRVLQTSLEACIDYSHRFRQQPPAATLKYQIDGLARALPGLAWCFTNGSFEVAVGSDC
jgi:hypothetical protein